MLTNCETVLVPQYKMTKGLISHHPHCMMPLKDLEKSLCASAKTENQYWIL